MKWINVYDHQDDVIARWSHFAVEKDGFVVSVVETQVVVEMQSTVFPPDFVQAGQKIFDVSRGVPIALFELILL